MKKLKLFILTFICTLFSISISSVESLQQLCAEQIAKELTSDDMLKQFRNKSNFSKSKIGNLNLIPKNSQDIIKDIIFWYRPYSPLGASTFGHWILSRLYLYSPDGRFIAYPVDNKRTLKIYNLQNNTILHTLDHGYRINTVEWSPNGKYIAVTPSRSNLNNDFFVHIWNLQNDTPLNTPSFSTLDYDGGHIYPIGWSKNGKHIATCCTENDINQIWDSETGELLVNPIDSIAEDGKHITPSYRDTSLDYSFINTSFEQFKNLSLEQTLLLALIYHDHIKKKHKHFRNTHNSLGTILKRDCRAMDDPISQSCSCKRLRK